MLIEDVELDLDGLQVMPGLINAHDHMEFALFPRLGNGSYPNATAWARDIYHPERSPIAENLRIPKRIRLLWGGLRNLIAGATTVCEHNSYDPAFDEDFPVRAVKRYGWAHSLAFSEDVRERYQSTAPDAPFLIHAGEGTDDTAREEIFELDRLGVLRSNTVLIHSVAWDERGWNLLCERGASVIACPDSNLFTLGRTLKDPGRAALGTDSALTAEGDLLDALSIARQVWGQDSRAMVTSHAARVLRLHRTEKDFIAVEQFGDPPSVVVIAGQLRLIRETLARQLSASQRASFSRLEVQGRPPSLVRCDVPALIRETRRFVEGPLKLAGREIAC